MKNDDILFLKLISPNYGENLWHIKSIIEENHVEKLSFFELKKETIFYIKKMISNQIIQFDFAFNKINSNEVIAKIKEHWTEQTEYIELYTMVWFSSQKWYKEKLSSLGLTENKDWQTFVKENIGDLEQWIEENRPKE